MKKFIGIFVLLLSIASCGREIPQLWEPSAYVAGNVVFVEAKDVNKIAVRFSLSVDPAYAKSLSSYKFIETNIVLSYAEMNRTNDAIVYLYTSNDMAAGTNYNLIVSGVKDTEGYAVNVSTNLFNSFGSADYTAPGISITEPVADQLLGKTFLIYGSAHDDSGVDSVWIKVDGGDWAKADGTTTWNYTLDTSLYNETYQHTIYARAVDLLGNSEIQSVIVSIDRTDPSLTVSAPAADGNKLLNSGDSITFSGTASDGNNISYIAIILTNQYTNYTFTATWTGASTWTYSYTHTSSPKDESTNAFTVVAIDTAGNRTTIKRTLVVYRDNAVCLSTNGSSTGDGTAVYPMDTLAHAYTKSTSVGVTKIKVAEGTFNIGSTTLSSRFVEGGYSQDFSTIKTNFEGRTIFTGTLLGIGDLSGLRNLYLAVPVKIDIHSASAMSISNCVISNVLQILHNAPLNPNLYIRNNLFIGTGAMIAPYYSYIAYSFTMYFSENIVRRVPTQDLICLPLSYPTSTGAAVVFNCSNNLFLNQTAGSNIIFGYDNGNYSGNTYYLTMNIINNTFSNFTINPIYCCGASSGGSGTLTAKILKNKFIGTNSTIVYVRNNQTTVGSYAITLNATIESNSFHTLSKYTVYMQKAAYGSSDIRINRNWFTNTTRVYIMEGSNFADANYILTNWMMLSPADGYLFDADTGTYKTTIAAMEALSASTYMGNVDW